MEFFKINNETYACEIHQRNDNLPRLLMLHGFMGDHRVFDHLIENLCKFCNPVTLDLLGHGKSSRPEDPQKYYEDRQIDDLSEIIRKLNLAPIILSGYSMGGRLALKTAIACPELFSGLILESTTCGITDESKRKERSHTDEQRAQQIENDFQNFLAKWKDLELFQSPLPIKKNLVKNYHEIQQRQDPKALATSLRGFGTGSMTPVCDNLKKLDLPVLLMAGSEDEKYQRVNRYLVNQFPDASFSSLKAGHRIHLDNPSAFVSELKKFIDINTSL